MHAADEHVGRWMHSTGWRNPLVEIEIDPSEELAGIKVKVAMRRSCIDMCLYILQWGLGTYLYPEKTRVRSGHDMLEKGN